MTTTLLQAENLAKSFRVRDGKTLKVVENISITLAPGEIVCLLGASGSGKTTLLRMLAGFEIPDGGSIRSGIRRPGAELGYMTQSDALLPWRQIVDNVSLGPELLGSAKREARHRAQALLKKTGMDEFTDSYPHQISGGMRQRALLARTLAPKPQLVLLDEPMSNLDVLARRQMADVLKDYVRSYRAAAVVVTHSVEEACFLADRILLMTRRPAVIYSEMVAASVTLDLVMRTLLETLEGAP